MDHKPQFLHELLKEDQEPFQLNTYISQKHSHFNKKSSTSLQLSKTSTKFKNLCFFSFQSTPDVRRSPFREFMSPAAMSPCKSSNGTVFLQIPCRTASILMEAAMRIQKQGKNREQSKNSGFGLFGSFLRRLKDRSKNKNNKHAIQMNNSEISKGIENVFQVKVDERDFLSSCWTESFEDDDESLDFEASTSECSSPFRFSLRKSASSSGCCTPEFCSPSRNAQQEKDTCGSKTSNSLQGEEDEKDQFSPVSVLDRPFEVDEQDSQDDEDYDVYDQKYAGTRQQLLYKLQRFEKLAELNPMELDGQSHEVSDNDDLAETEFVTEVFNQSRYVEMSTDMKRLVSDLIVEEENEVVHSEVVLGRICNRLDSWKDVEFDTIDMMVELDFKRDFYGWKKFDEQREEVVAEIELEIFKTLMEELSEDLLQIH